jgi:hypothetical protein
MSQVIIFTNDTGGVSVCVPTGELPIEQVLAKDCPEGAMIVDNNSLPKEHSNFFDAWELNGTTVTVNLTKAKAITKDRLRMERAPLLVAQDVLYMRATEASQDTTAIVAEKQRLRDITKLADDATTLDQLKALKVEG